jgi:hypothetical protein
MRVLRLPGAVRPLLLFVVGSLGVAAVVLTVVTALGNGPPLWFTLVYLVGWLWIAYWWTWHTPLTIEIHPDGRLGLVSALGRRTEIAPKSVRSLTMSVFRAPLLRYQGGARGLFLSPVAELVSYFQAERPEVEVNIPQWATRPHGWPWP